MSNDIDLKQVARNSVVALDDGHIGLLISESAITAKELNKSAEWVSECLKAAADKLVRDRGAVIVTEGSDGAIIRLKGVSTSIAADAVREQFQSPVQKVPAATSGLLGGLSNGPDDDSEIELDAPVNAAPEAKAPIDAPAPASAPPAMASVTKKARNDGMATDRNQLAGAGSPQGAGAQDEQNKSMAPGSLMPQGSPLDTAVGMGFGMAVGLPYGLARLALSPLTIPAKALASQFSKDKSAPKISASKVTEEKYKAMNAQLESASLARERASEAADVLSGDDAYRDARSKMSSDPEGIKRLASESESVSKAISQIKDSAHIDAQVAHSIMGELTAKDGNLPPEVAQELVDGLQKGQEEREALAERIDGLVDEDGNDLAEIYHKVAEAIKKLLMSIATRLGLVDQSDAAPSMAAG